MDKSPFDQNVVILTGASSGIGREMALQLAAQGAWLALAARTTSRLNELAELCKQRGGRVLVVTTDVTDQAQCQRLIRQAVQEYGWVDTLINNAGRSMWSRFEDLLSLDPMEYVMRVNYFGSLYCTHAALPYLKQSQGRIVVVSSLAGKAGIPTRSGYAASKHALEGFFDSLRIELAQSGISVTIVCPDFVATQTRQQAFGFDGKPLGKSPVQEEKVMTAEECARLILHAAIKRKRQVIMGFRGNLGLWLRMIAPGIVDHMAARAIAQGR